MASLRNYPLRVSGALLCSLMPLAARADLPSYNGTETLCGVGLLFGLPFMLLFTLLYLFGGRSWAFVLALPAAAGSAICSFGIGSIKEPFVLLMLLLPLTCILLLFLKRRDLLSR